MYKVDPKKSKQRSHAGYSYKQSVNESKSGDYDEEKIVKIQAAFRGN